MLYLPTLITNEMIEATDIDIVALAHAQQKQKILRTKPVLGNVIHRQRKTLTELGEPPNAQIVFSIARTVDPIE